MDRKRGFFFHPEAWLSDNQLSLCSYATKGVWIELMCHMFSSKRAGYLMIEGKPLNKGNIKHMLKCRSNEEFDMVWNELIQFGVMRQHADGTYYSKRMVDDMESISLTSTASDEEMELAKSVLEELKRTVPNLRGYNGEEARTLIIARSRDGATFEDFKSVIHSKYEEWKNDEKMFRWIRPLTLFGEKFNRYVEEAKVEKPTISTNGYELVRDPSYDY